MDIWAVNGTTVRKVGVLRYSLPNELTFLLCALYHSTFLPSLFTLLLEEFKMTTGLLYIRKDAGCNLSQYPNKEIALIVIKYMSYNPYAIDGTHKAKYLVRAHHST